MIEPPAPCGLPTVSQPSSQTRRLDPSWPLAGVQGGTALYCQNKDCTKQHAREGPPTYTRGGCTTPYRTWHPLPALVLLDELRVPPPVAASSFAAQPGSSTALLPLWQRQVGWSCRPTNSFWSRAKLVGLLDQPTNSGSLPLRCRFSAAACPAAAFRCSLLLSSLASGLARVSFLMPPSGGSLLSGGALTAAFSAFQRGSAGHIGTVVALAVQHVLAIRIR